jgi:hypothetical protein
VAATSDLHDPTPDVARRRRTDAPAFRARAVASAASLPWVAADEVIVWSCSFAAAFFVFPSSALVLAHCGGKDGAVDDPVSAQLSYLGLDRAIDRAIDLGFDGFNAATAPTSRSRWTAASSRVNGRQWQGRSGRVDQQEYVAHFTLSDDYSTPCSRVSAGRVQRGPALLDLSFKGCERDFTGTLQGSFAMTGDLTDGVTTRPPAHRRDGGAPKIIIAPQAGHDPRGSVRRARITVYDVDVSL